MQFKFAATVRVSACSASRSPTCATVATMAEALVLDTYPVTISNIYVTSSRSSLFSMQVVLSSRNVGVFGCSIVRWLKRDRPVKRYSRPRRALSPQPCAPGRLCSPPCIVIVSLACSFSLSFSHTVRLIRSLPLRLPHSLFVLLAGIAPSAAHFSLLSTNLCCARTIHSVYSLPCYRDLPDFVYRSDAIAH